MHLAVAAAVAVATAVLTGALVVGDSVRGSLRDLTLQRLGTIDHALTTPGLFRAELATELAATPGFDKHFAVVMPALVTRGSASSRSKQGTRRANELDLFGVPPAFWGLGRSDPRGIALDEGVWLTQDVASELDVAAGDEVLLRLPLVSNVPADSPLGEKVDTIASQRFKVAGVLPNRGLARFGLQPSQRPPRAVFVPLGELAEAMDVPGRANTLLVAGDRTDQALGGGASSWLAENFKPRLADYGLAMKQVRDNVLQLSSAGLVLPAQVVDSAGQAFGANRLQPVVTYLANTLRAGDRSLPYSTVAGVRSTADLGPLLDDAGRPIAVKPGEVILNSWAAAPEHLDAKIGDTLTLSFYEPESTHGNLREREPPLALTVTGIVPLVDENGKPTAAADPELTPELAGVTDKDSVEAWELPFDLTEKITDEDEAYWDDYRTTPKAFVSFDQARDAWGTRWGSVSLIRIPATEDLDAATAAAKLRRALDPAALGFAFQPVKQQGLAAASGTTPFDGLFLGFSMFLIAAAIMLLVLLFRLAIESRASEIGLLAALGFSPGRARQLLASEAMMVAACGAVIGMLLGIAYASAMVAGLRTLWVAAVAAPFLELHIGRWSLPIGLLTGLSAAAATTWLTLRSVLHRSPRELLAGEVDEPPAALVANVKKRRWPIAEAMLFAAVLLGLWGVTIRGEAQAGAFFGVGALVLAGLLALVRRWLRRQASERTEVREFSLSRLALANLARRPGRSTLTLGLVASASFLLLAISAFRLAPSQQGTGGYDWFGTTDIAIHYDLDDPAGRLELGFRDSEQARLAACAVESLRVHGGEDASCLNLYKTAQPRVLGLRDGRRVLGGFAWAATRSESGQPPDLNADIGNDERGRAIVPVVLDFNTAMYSLHLSGSVGDRVTIRDGDDQPVTLEIVGLLKNSILQGDLLVSDEHFRQLYPSESGSRLFLIGDLQRAGISAQRADDSPPLDVLLENRLGDYGFAMTAARDRLASFLAVQNTYLTTFQTLGGLGLLLGTIGLAVVQLRNVLERRGELALLQAVGFRRPRVEWLVLVENLMLLNGGLLLGGLAAALTLLPQLGLHETTLPWQTMLTLMLVILAVGAIATWLTTRQVLGAPLLASLRGD